MICFRSKYWLYTVCLYCFSLSCLGLGSRAYGSFSASDNHERTQVKVPELPGVESKPSVQTQNIAIDRHDLLFTNFATPTTAMRISDAGNTGQLKVFEVVEPTSVNYNSPDFAKQAGIHHYGGTLDIQLNEPLIISAGYIGGKHYWDTPEAQHQNTSFQASSWNVAANTQWLDRSISTRLEYARSKQEADTDHAIFAEMMLSSEGQFDAGWFDYWSSQIQYRSIGTEYYSMGNRELNRGQELTRMDLKTSFQGIDMTMEWQQLCHCTQSHAKQSSPVQELAGLNIHYSFNELSLQQPTLRWLNALQLGARYYRTEKSAPKAQLWNDGYRLESKADAVGVNLRLISSLWTWTIDYQVSQLNQYHQAHQAESRNLTPPPDWTNQATQLQLSIAPFEYLSLNMNATWRQHSQIDSNDQILFRNYWIEAQLQMLPETLSLLMRYDYGFRTRDLHDSAANPFDYRSHYGNTQMSWHATKVNGQRPAIDVYLKSSFRKQEDLAAEQEDLQWSAHLGFEIHWGKGK